MAKMDKVIVFTGNINGRWVSVDILDLNDFIHALPEDFVFCVDENGEQFQARKIDIDFTSVYFSGDSCGR